MSQPHDLTGESMSEVGQFLDSVNISLRHPQLTSILINPYNIDLEKGKIYRIFCVILRNVEVKMIVL